MEELEFNLKVWTEIIIKITRQGIYINKLIYLYNTNTHKRIMLGDNKQINEW